MAKNIFQILDESFGPLLPYVKDTDITDIDYNGKEVFITHLKKGRYPIDLELSDAFVKTFAQRVANTDGAQFNKYDNSLEGETENLRVSIVHEEVTDTGYSIVIRKTPPVRRLTSESMLNEGYCSEEILNLIQNCMLGHMNIVICGLPGSGKTELLKYLTQFIPSNEKVITIEDNLEIRYRDINPGCDCVSLKVDSEYFDYSKAIKVCLRQNPTWILLSEARSVEVKYLLESFSTGVYGLTTMHTDDVRKIPARVQNMMNDSYAADRMKNDVYNFVNMGIMIRKKTTGHGIKRYIDQICFFDRNEHKNKHYLVVEGGKLVSKELPDNILKKFRLYDVENPFSAIQ